MRMTAREGGASAKAAAPRIHPRLILLAGLLVICAGQLLNGMARRAWVFLAFAALFGWISLNLVSPALCAERGYAAWHCFLLRHGGLLFIWLIAALDAYAWARVNAALRKSAGIASS